MTRRSLLLKRVMVKIVVCIAMDVNLIGRYCLLWAGVVRHGGCVAELDDFLRSCDVEFRFVTVTVLFVYVSAFAGTDGESHLRHRFFSYFFNHIIKRSLQSNHTVVNDR